MPKRKKPTVEEARTLKMQFEDYAKDLVDEFETVTGLKVERIDIVRRRPAGFFAEEETIVNIITDL